MRTPDPTAERTIAESRLRSITAPTRRSRRSLGRLTGAMTEPAAGAHARTHDSAQQPGQPSTEPREREAWDDAALTLRHGTRWEDPAPAASGEGEESRWNDTPSRTPPEGHDHADAVTSRAPHQIPNQRSNASPPPDQKRGPAPVPPTFQAFRAALTSQAPALDPGKPGLRVLLVLGALAAAVAAFFLWRSQPSPEPLPPPTPISHPPRSPSPTAVAKVTVHVTGKIRKPGVYLLPTGARVTDAVAAAGGVSRGASTGTLNLARRLIDGEQIVVGTPTGQATQASPIADPATTLLDLNSATTDQLEQLPGVGEVLAARIAQFRDTHGGFTTVEQLREVTGIGPRKYEELKPKVRV